MVLERFLHEEPSSPYVRSFYAASFLGIVALGVSEFGGKNLQYSKFWNSSKSGRSPTLIGSRTGMLICYTPALIAAVLSFWLDPETRTRSLLLKSALTLHFLKRIFE
ncbi:uncharacterized protein LOC127261107 isoform X2 [Andrographis paniculata]|nr:uncharacterized protein LOC127261107 isoform X2 [Andrographis paniculata]